MFRLVSETGDYDYVHLISGVDLPLKSQDEIHQFFDQLDEGTNVVGFAQGDFNANDLNEKTEYYHLFTEHQKNVNELERRICKAIRMAWLWTQRKMDWKRNWGEMTLKKGANWVSITGDFCRYLSDNAFKIVNRYQGVPCADEIFIQTEIFNSPYKDTVFDYSKDFAGMTRKIDWVRGKPYVWRNRDFSELIDSQALFARKFSSAVDKTIINRISEWLENK